MCTVVWWAGQTIESISPREHELLFHFMEVTVPKHTDERDRLLLNDVTALMNVSAPVRTSTYHFAHQHNFFDLMSATHRLTSLRVLRRKGRLVWMIVRCVPFFVSINVENFLAHKAPAYVSPREDSYAVKHAFCWASDVVSVCMLFCFVWLCLITSKT